VARKPLLERAHFAAMSTTHGRTVDRSRDPTMGKQTKAHRRREMAMRATLCRQQAIAKGYRHVCPLIDVLADYASLSGRLPWPSQVTMAHEAGVTDRTIRNWLAILEDLGLVAVFRSTPKLIAGQWSRATNRYLLCSRKATAMPRSMPVRRRRNPLVLPSGNGFPLTNDGLYRGGADNVEAAPTSAVTGSAEPRAVSN